MKIQNQYIIPFSGLKEGVHDFELDFPEGFFDEFPAIEARGGKLLARISLLKSTNLLTFTIAITGDIQLQCDRCLDFYSQDIDFRGNLYVKFSEKADVSETSDELIFLHPDEHEINLGQYLYESISLSIPYKRMHPENDGKNACNPEMLKYISNNRKEVRDAGSNPVWDKLKDFLET